MIRKEDVIALIDYRIRKLLRDRHKTIIKIDEEKKRHPANKQIHGRVKELRYIRRRINEIKNVR